MKPNSETNKIVGGHNPDVHYRAIYAPTKRILEIQARGTEHALQIAKDSAAKNEELYSFQRIVTYPNTPPEVWAINLSQPSELL